MNNGQNTVKTMSEDNAALMFDPLSLLSTQLCIQQLEKLFMNLRLLLHFLLFYGEWYESQMVHVYADYV